MVATVYVLAIHRGIFRETNSTVSFRTAAPGYLWLMVGFIAINGLAPYLGLKTETSAAMYSNLRTEGGTNNHLFMPALRLTGYQDDLVEITQSDHPVLSGLIKRPYLKDRHLEPRKLLITYFELQRIVSETDYDFSVSNVRDGAAKTFVQRDGIPSDSALAARQSLLERKLLLFRPVFAGDVSYCQH